MLGKKYRPVSTFPCVLKIFERIMQKQLWQYIEKIFITIFMQLQEKLYAQTASIRKMETSLDKKGYAGAVLIDLTKAFDTINHE